MIPLVPREVRVRLGHVRADVALASGEEGALARDEILGVGVKVGEERVRGERGEGDVGEGDERGEGRERAAATGRGRRRGLLRAREDHHLGSPC